MTTPNVTSSTVSQMHNNIMAAGYRDRPPMLAPGRYPQWRLRFLRYVDTRPNGEALRKCILSGPYKPTTVLVQAVEATDNSPAVPEHTTVETPTSMALENKAHFLAEKEAIHLILTGIGDDIYSTVDACQTAQEMWEAIERSSAPSTKPSIPSRSHTTTRNKGKEIAKPITPSSETASEEDGDPEQTQGDKDMQKNLALIAKYFKKIYKPTNNNLRTSSNSKNKNVVTTPRYKNDNQYGQFENQRTVNVVGARENVGSSVVQQSGIQYTDEEIDEQELEAHYSYMEKIQETKSVLKTNVSEGLSKPVTAQTLPQTAKQAIVQLILFIIDSGCTKHMTGNLKLLCNFVEKFLDTARFGNDQFALILGYGYLVKGNVMINKVYYVEGLNHNLFSVGQFCDTDLEVAFRKSACFVRDLQGNDLLTGNRGSDIYMISLQESTSSTLLCLMAKATPTQAWLWHRRLSHLNFDYINLLLKKDIMIGLPKLKYIKDQLCSSCELSKAKRSSFKSKAVPNLFRAPTAHDMEILIQTCLMPLAIKTQRDSLKFVHELKQEMNADLKYVESLEKEINELESKKDKFSDMYDEILHDCVSKDVTCSYLQSLSDLDALAELQCMYLHKKNIRFLLKLLCKIVKNSELKKLIEKGKGKSMDTKFNRPSVVRQPNAQRIPKPSVLGKPTPFLDSLERKYFPKTRSIQKTNVSKGVNHKPNVSRPQLKSNQSRDKVLPNNSQVKVKKTQVEVHPIILSVSNKIKSIVQLILFILDCGCTKHMTGNLKLLCNFIEMFLGTVRFGNDQFVPILGYGDLVQGNVMINRVYYVEGLNHNLFSIGQFCDADLEVAFRKSTCFVRDLQGNDLLTGNRRSDLYTISLQKSTSSTPLCLMAKATPTQAWINYVYCELSKAKRSSFKSKVVPSSKGRLNLLLMDLCGPMQVAIINGKKYILVIADDYSRYTWTLFLLSKDETPEVLKVFLTMIQRNLQAPVITVRTDRGTKFLNKTLNAFFKEEAIEHQTSTARTPEQNDKLKEKRDQCILVGYSTESKGYRVYNKRTRMIVKSIHIRFDEIKEVSETSVANNTSGLVPQRKKVSNYENPDPVPQQQDVYSSANEHVPSQQELDLLFGP
nr:integrase, catalytic region, zinc finger, CCHC-type, peptidase aspartic, catalytic [Tanacetum cinerariifolium]